MAVTKVTATLANDTEELTSTSESEYSGEVTAPEESGAYSVTVAAYDDAGNVSTYSEDVEVSLWHTPKTDWTADDRFNYVDYNRIKNNIQYLYEFALTMWNAFSIEDMGDDIETYAAFWDVDYFNMWERNLEVLNNNTFLKDLGDSKTYYENGVFIDYNELNRIESALLELLTLLENQKKLQRRISFRLGAFRAIRI